MADSAAPPQTMLDLAPSLRTPGFRLVDAGELYELFRALFSVKLPFPAGPIANPPILSAAFNIVGLVSGANSAVGLPPSLPGKVVTVVNSSANAITVVGYTEAGGQDQIVPIDSVTPAPTIVQAGGTTGVYLAYQRASTAGPAYWKQLSVQ